MSVMLRLAVLIIGFSTITAQMIFLREILLRFHGMEMSVGIALASWLLWTAVGML
jgi:spermidine synthase